MKRAVDIGGVEMVIEEKVKKEKVVVPEEKSSTSQVNWTTTKSFFKYLLIGGSCCDQGMAWSSSQRSFSDWGTNPIMTNWWYAPTLMNSEWYSFPPVVYFYFHFAGGQHRQDWVWEACPGMYLFLFIFEIGTDKVQKIILCRAFTKYKLWLNLVADSKTRSSTGWDFITFLFSNCLKSIIFL